MAGTWRTRNPVHNHIPVESGRNGGGNPGVKGVGSHTRRKTREREEGIPRSQELRGYDTLGHKAWGAAGENPGEKGWEIYRRESQSDRKFEGRQSRTRPYIRVVSVEGRGEGSEIARKGIGSLREGDKKAEERIPGWPGKLEGTQSQTRTAKHQ